MTANITIGIDARLSGREHAGLGRHIMNLCLRLPFYAPVEYQFVYFVKDKTQWSEIISHLGELPLPPNANAQQYLTRVKIVEAPIPHYSWAEQTEFPKLIAAENLSLLHVPHFNLPYFAKAPKIVLTIHDLLWHEKKGPEATTLPMMQYYVKYFGYKVITGHATKVANAIITPSSHIRAVVKHFYPKVADKIHVIYNGVNDLGGPNCPPVNLKLPSEYLLYVGSLYPHKNVDLLLRALSQNRDLKLVLVSARDAFWEKTQARIKADQLENQVTYLHNVNDCQLRYLYEHALALVQPSESEGFGLTGIEAMRCGCLVMASDIPVFHEVYGDHFISFDPHDPTAFLQKVLSLTSQRRPEVLQPAYDFSIRYNWDQMTQQTLQVYAGVLTESAS